MSIQRNKELDIKRNRSLCTYQTTLDGKTNSLAYLLYGRVSVFFLSFESKSNNNNNDTICTQQRRKGKHWRIFRVRFDQRINCLVKIS